jgi:hypothetical protein
LKSDLIYNQEKLVKEMRGDVRICERIELKWGAREKSVGK